MPDQPSPTASAGATRPPWPRSSNTAGRRCWRSLNAGSGRPCAASWRPQDVLQELAVKALRELPNADLSTRDPFGWLCHLAEQCIVDDHRHFAAGKRASGREVPGNVRVGDGSQDLVALLAASLTSPSMAVVRDERQRRLHGRDRHLAGRAPQALRLRYGEGLPTKDVAQRLGKSDVATRVLLSRLVQQLQERLEE